MKKTNRRDSRKDKKQTNFKKIVIRIVILLFLIVGNGCSGGIDSGESYKSYDYQSKSIPITIKVPQQWFTKEETDYSKNAHILYLSREQITERNNLIQVGISILYFKNDKTLQDISFVHYSAEFIKNLEKQGYKLTTPVIVVEKIYGLPAWMIGAENQKIHMMFLNIQIGNDLLQLTTEAPLSEAAKYSKVFSKMLESLKIRRGN